MSERKVFDWILTDGYGGYRKTVKVVSYWEKITCPWCKGVGKVPYDNRITVDFSDQYYGPAEPEPWEQNCSMCGGTGIYEKLDAGSMTAEQLWLYQQWEANLRRECEEFNEWWGPKPYGPRERSPIQDDE